MISDFRPRKGRPTFKYEPIQSIRQQGRTAKAENEKAIRETTPLQGRARANPNIQGNDLSRLHVYTQDQCESITIRPTSHAALQTVAQTVSPALRCVTKFQAGCGGCRGQLLGGVLLQLIAGAWQRLGPPPGPPNGVTRRYLARSRRLCLIFNGKTD